MRDQPNRLVLERFDVSRDWVDCPWDRTTPSALLAASNVDGTGTSSGSTGLDDLVDSGLLHLDLSAGMVGTTASERITPFPLVERNAFFDVDRMGSLARFYRASSDKSTSRSKFTITVRYVIRDAVVFRKTRPLFSVARTLDSSHARADPFFRAKFSTRTVHLHNWRCDKGTRKVVRNRRSWLMLQSVQYAGAGAHERDNWIDFIFRNAFSRDLHLHVASTQLSFQIVDQFRQLDFGGTREFFAIRLRHTEEVLQSPDASEKFALFESLA